MLEQALDAYGDNSYYQNEQARTLYKLGHAQVVSGRTELGDASIAQARDIFMRIKPDVDTDQVREVDFDNLVMSWFR